MDRGFKAYWQTQRSAKPLSTTLKAPPRRIPAYQRPQQKLFAAAPVPATEKINPVAATVLDSLLWHGAASLVLPYVVINRQIEKTK